METPRYWPLIHLRGTRVGIDPVEVAILAFASIIGAVGAAIVWATFTNLFRIRRKALASFGFLLIGAVSGLAFLYPYLAPVLAPTLVRILPDPIYFDEALEDPLLSRLVADHPDLMHGLEARLITAHLVAGLDGVRFEGERIGLQKSTGLTADYFSRARGEDLVALMELQGEVFEDLAISDPELCYPFLFGLQANEAEIALRMDEEIPLNVEQRTQDLILNAATSVPAFDHQLGEFVIRKAQVDIALDHGERGIRLMSGNYRPQTAEEATELCAIYSRFFAAVSSEGPQRAEAAWRSMFVPIDES